MLGQTDYCLFSYLTRLSENQRILEPEPGMEKWRQLSLVVGLTRRLEIGRDEQATTRSQALMIPNHSSDGDTPWRDGESRINGTSGTTVRGEFRDGMVGRQNREGAW